MLQKLLNYLKNKTLLQKLSLWKLLIIFMIYAIGKMEIIPFEFIVFIDMKKF